MEIGYIIVFVLGGIVAFSIYATLFSNPRIAGSGFFEKYLIEQGVDPKIVPIKLQDELIQISVQVTDMMLGTNERKRTNRLKWNAAFEDQLKFQAALLSAYLSPSKDKFQEIMLSLGESPESAIGLYQKHGL